MNRDILVLGGSTKLYQPDAIENATAAASMETDVTGELLTHPYSPFGTEGVVRFRAVHVIGYHRATVSFWITPLVDGRERTDNRKYQHIVGPSSGKEEKFHAIIPLSVRPIDFPRIRVGLRGATIQVFLEAITPVANWHLETIGYEYDPLGRVRARSEKEKA